MRTAIAPAAFNQPLDFWLGQVFSGAHVGVPGAARGFDFPYLVSGDTIFKAGFGIEISAPFQFLTVKSSKYGKLQWSFIEQKLDRGRQKAPAATEAKSKQGSS